MGNLGTEISLCLRFIFNKINLVNTNTEPFSLTMLSGPPAGQTRMEHQQPHSKEAEFHSRQQHWVSWVPSRVLPEKLESPQMWPVFFILTATTCGSRSC